MTIRATVSGDFPGLAGLKARAFEATYRPLLGAAEYAAFSGDATPGWFERRVADGHAVLVAEEGGIVGFAVFGPNSLDVPADRELRNVYVEPSRTSGGVGRALVDASLARMRDEGATAVSLGVFPENVRAIAFYERLGFVRHKVSIWHRGSTSFADQIMLRTL